MVFGSFKVDYQFGIEQEKRVYEVLKQSKLRKNLEHSANPRAPWDFYSKRAVYELKSRRMLSTEYDETLIDYRKIENAIEAESQGLRSYFLFNFQDGVYYVKFDYGLFLTFRTEYSQFKPRSDKVSLPSKRIFIPISYLRRIITWGAEGSEEGGKEMTANESALPTCSALPVNV